jgi:hypothetical protein
MFILIVKDPDGTPPERTVWIEPASHFSIACASSNLLRPVFARTFRLYRKLPVGVKRIPVDSADTPHTFRKSPPGPVSKGGGRGKAPNFKRPNLRAKLAILVRGRLVAQGKIQDENRPDSRFAMDCSVWLTVGLRHNDCRTDLLRSSSRLGQNHPLAKPCHCFLSRLLYHVKTQTANVPVHDATC